MSRLIEFDINQVIHNAMYAFWNKGLATTISEIENATGLSRSSIYNTLGNKDEIFRLVINCYLDFLTEWLDQKFGNLSFKEYLKALLEDAATDNFEGRGCFFYNCAGAAGTLSLKNKKILDLAYIDLKNTFEKRILLAQKNHQLDSNINPSTHATLIMVTISGLRTFNNSGFPKDDLKKAAENAFSQLS